MGDAKKAPVRIAREFLPEELSLSSLRDAARHCQGCSLYENATQTVFGEGQRTCRVMLIGEQPGNDEDLQGRPFVGPAGRVLYQALEAAGIERDDAYVTNVVKHFKWTPQGKRRLHKTRGSREIAACWPWLEKEIELIEPEVLVCLGATAAKALLGRDFRVTEQRGHVLPSQFDTLTVATVHPSSILRMPASADRKSAMERFIADLKVVARLLDANA
jgi:DNA polymerase